MLKKGKLGLAALALLALLLLSGFACADVRNESLFVRGALETLASVKTIDGAQGFHSVDYQADYALDELMKKGADSQAALDAFISERLLNGLPFHNEGLRLACSTFSAAMPNGDHLHARNMDLGGAQSFIVRTRPKNGYASLSMVSGLPLGYIDRLPESEIGRLWLLALPYYLTDGINEKGLSVAILLLQDTPVRQETGKPKITTMLALRLMLDRAATVDEAIALLLMHDMRSIYDASYHYHIADAQGNSAVVEYVEDKMRVVRPKGHGQVATNFFLSPEKFDLLDDGKDRLEKLQGALDRSKGVVDAEQAWQMLKSVEAVHDYDERTGIDFNTAYSILYNNTRRTMDVCVNADFNTVHSWRIGGEF